MNSLADYCWRLYRLPDGHERFERDWRAAARHCLIALIGVQPEDGFRRPPVARTREQRLDLLSTWAARSSSAAETAVYQLVRHHVRCL